MRDISLIHPEPSLINSSNHVRATSLRQSVAEAAPDFRTREFRGLHLSVAMIRNLTISFLEILTLLSGRRRHFSGVVGTETC